MDGISGDKMKLKQYLTEEDIREKLKSQLKKDCAPFFKEVRGAMSPWLFRGTTKSIGGKYPWAMVNRRKDRSPLFLSQALTNFLDKWHKKKFGWRVRSEGVFTSASLQAANSYGTARLFVPIGKYRYILHNNIWELYGYYDMLQQSSEGSEPGSLDFWDEPSMWRHFKRVIMKRSEEEAKKAFIAELKKYKSTNLKKYLNNPNRWSECIFDVDKYYIIDDNPTTREILVELANDK